MKRTVHGEHRLRAKLLVAGAFASALVLGIAGMASAVVDNGTSTQQVPTAAHVTGSGDPGNIECSWALPDLNPKGGLETNNTGTPNPTPPLTFWYGQDDDPATTPGSPCDLGPNGSKPQMANNVHHMIQVLPNAQDQPAQRRIELWAAVDHPAGINAITDVYWKVYHGDGTLKVQVHGVRIDASKTNPDCNGPVTAKPGDSTTMFQAAIATGQLTNGAVHDPTNGMIALCQEGVKAFYHNTFLVSKDQPNGEYKIETHEVSTGGLETVQTYYIDIIPFYDMALDFSSVNFGQIIPGLPKTVNGDTTFNPPNSPSPTVLNEGNSAMGIGLLFGNLMQTTDQNGNPVQGGKVITTFDGSFGLSAATIQHIAVINAGTLANFDDAGNRQLCPNDDGKLDLSVDPPPTLPAGTYAGTVSVIAHSPTIKLCPTDHGHLYTPNSGVRGTT